MTTSLVPNAKSQQGINSARVEDARTLFRPFDRPCVGQIVPVILDPDVSDSDQDLKGEAGGLHRDDRPRTAQTPKPIGLTPPTPRSGCERDVGTRRCRHLELSRSFRVHLGALRRIDLALMQIDRCIVGARDDLWLREHWHCLKRRYREESYRLTRLIGDEAVQLDRISRRRCSKSPRKTSQYPTKDES